MINNQNIPFNNKDKLLKILFWSVTFYTFFSTLSTSFFPATLIDVIYKVSLLSSVLLIVISIYKYKNTKKNKNYYVLYLFFFLYSLKIVFTGNFSVLETKAAILTYNNAFTYLVPFIYLIQFTIYNWINLSKNIYKIALLFIPFLFPTFILDRNDLGVSIENTLVPLLGFLFMILNVYGKGKKNKIITFAFWVLFILVSVYWGRRGRSLSMMYYLIGGIVISIKYSMMSEKSRQFKKFATFFFTIFFCCLIFSNTQNISVFQRGFDQEAFEGSRGRVFEEFFNDFNTNEDYIFGRGLGGKVDRGIFGQERANSVENGWLTLLLQGGIIYLIPIIFLFIRAIYLGLYRSNNSFSIILSVIVIINILDMLASDMAGLNTRYILVWMATTTLFSKQFRNMSENTLRKLINYNRQ